MQCIFIARIITQFYYFIFILNVAPAILFYSTFAGINVGDYKSILLHMVMAFLPDLLEGYRARYAIELKSLKKGTVNSCGNYQ